MSVRAVRSGFTLLEVVATLIIVAIATALAVPAFRSLYEVDDMTRATQRIEALFRLARDSAIRGGQTVTVVIDSVSGLVWLDAPPFPGVADSLQDLRDEAVRTNPLTARAQSGATSGFAAGPVEPGTSLELPPSIRLELTRARARFAFSSGGGAFSDSLWLRSSAVTRMITVDPWSGDAIIW